MRTPRALCSGRPTRSASPLCRHRAIVRRKGSRPLGSVPTRARPTVLAEQIRATKRETEGPQWVVSCRSRFPRPAMRALRKRSFCLTPPHPTVRLFRRGRWQVDGPSDIVVHEGLPLLGAEDSRMAIAAWLRGLGLEQYEPAFRDNFVDADVVPRVVVDTVPSRVAGLLIPLSRCRAVCPHWASVEAVKCMVFIEPDTHLIPLHDRLHPIAQSGHR
jgi:SAM domain (Sterile alpha motif)